MMVGSQEWFIRLAVGYIAVAIRTWLCNCTTFSLSACVVCKVVIACALHTSCWICLSNRPPTTNMPAWASSSSCFVVGDASSSFINFKNLVNFSSQPWRMPLCVSSCEGDVEEESSHPEWTSIPSNNAAV